MTIGHCPKTHNFDLGKDFMPIENIFSKMEMVDVIYFACLLKKFELMPRGIDSDSDPEIDS